MNIVLAVVLLAVVLMQGADVLAYLDRPARSARCNPGRRPSAPASSPATSSRSSAPPTSARGNTSTWRWRRGPSAKSTSSCSATAREQRLKVRPDLTELRTRNNARFEVGTIGVLPDVYPSVASFVAGKPAESCRPQGRRRDPRDRRRAHGVRVAGRRDDLAEARRQADRVHRPPRRRRSDHFGDARTAKATGRCVGMYMSERRGRSSRRRSKRSA